MSPMILVFKKELRDMMRDKRVRTSAFIMPPLLIVMMMFLFGFLQETLSKPSNVKVHVVRGINPEVTKLLHSKGMQIVEIASVSEGEKLIKTGGAHIVLATPGYGKAGQDALAVDSYFDPKQDISKVALQQVAGAMAEKARAEMDTLVKVARISTSGLVMHPVPHEITVGGKSSVSDMVVGVLPYLIVVWAFFGGMSVATELVAGEKEKSTLETLLISPVTRSQIALGKFLSLCCICLVCSLSSFIGLYLFASSGSSMAKGLFPDGVGITPVSALLILAALLPTVALFASMLLAISTFAKNTREAQTYLAGVNFIVIMPAMVSQFIGFTEFGSSQWVYAIPVLNTAKIIRQALQAQINALGILTCATIGIVLAAIGIKIAVTLFNRESVLTRI